MTYLMGAMTAAQKACLNLGKGGLCLRLESVLAQRNPSLSKKLVPPVRHLVRGSLSRKLEEGAISKEGRRNFFVPIWGIKDKPQWARK